MTRPPVPIVLWALLLAALCALLGVFGDATLTFELLGSAAGLTAVIAIAVAMTTGVRDTAVTRPSEPPRPRAAPDLSYATTLLALSIACIGVGFAVGPWLLDIGGGMALLAAGGLVRETRAQRRAVHVASQGRKEVRP